MTTYLAETVATGIYFGEAPRWHDHKLWFSDFYAHRVYSLGDDGALTTEFELDDQPSGLGWMPDGSMLVVKMKAREVWRRFPDGRFELHADLAEHSSHLCNDMVVDALGRAYIGNFGFDLDAAINERGVPSVLADHPVTPIALVYPDGSVISAAGDERFSFPNGMVITPEGKTLIVGETMGGRLSAFHIKKDGKLVSREVWASTFPRIPDGICLDTDGAIWIANPTAPECVRLGKGGEVLDVVETGGLIAYACMLGGDDGQDLYICAAPSSDARKASSEPLGQIMRAKVGASRAGRP